MVPKRLHLDIDGQSYERLAEMAIQCRRPIGWQAEVLLIQAIAEAYLSPLRVDPSAGGQVADVEASV